MTYPRCRNGKNRLGNLRGRIRTRKGPRTASAYKIMVKVKILRDR